MTTKQIKLIAFIILLIHGIGHFQGVIAGTGVKLNTRNSSYQSWLLKGFGNQKNKIICLILYLFTAISSIITALSFKDILFSQNYWQNFALITAIFSILALILFWNALAMFFNKFGAIAVNILIILSFTSYRWPIEIFE